MKRLIFLFLISVTMVLGQTLATQGGYSLTQQHLNEYYKFVVFILGQQPDASDQPRITQDLIQSFNQNPMQTLQSINALPQQMQAIYSSASQNPIQYALARSMFLAQLYMAYAQQMQATGQAPLMMQLIDKYTPIITIDAQNSLAFTEKDLEGIIKLAKINAQLQGQNFSASQQEIQQMRETMENQFMSLDLESRQALCVMGIYGDLMEQAYSQLTPQQKQQLMQQYASSQQQAAQYQQYAQQYQGSGQKSIYDMSQQEFAAYVQNLPVEERKKLVLAYMKNRMQTNNMLFNTMNNIMNMQHVTNSNIISNIGSGNYEYRMDYDY